MEFIIERSCRESERSIPYMALLYLISVVAATARVLNIPMPKDDLRGLHSLRAVLGILDLGYVGLGSKELGLT